MSETIHIVNSYCLLLIARIYSNWEMWLRVISKKITVPCVKNVLTDDNSKTVYVQWASLFSGKIGKTHILWTILRCKVVCWEINTEPFRKNPWLVRCKIREFSRRKSGRVHARKSASLNKIEPSENCYDDKGMFSHIFIFTFDYLLDPLITCGPLYDL